MHKHTEAIIIGIGVIAAVGVGIAYYANQENAQDQSKASNPSNNSTRTNNTKSVTQTALNNSSSGPRCNPLIINNTGSYCITANGVEFDPRHNSTSIHQGGIKIGLCESFIAQNSKGSSVLRFDDYQNPILIVKRAGSEVAVPICYTSTVGQEMMWRPAAGFPHVSYLFDNGTSRIGFDEHVHTRLDKELFTVPAFHGEPVDYANPAAPRGSFTVFIAADNEAKVGDHSFAVSIDPPNTTNESKYIPRDGTGIEFDVVDYG